MKRLCVGLVFVCTTAWGQVPTIELKEHPPLEPLNWCTDSNGVTRGQIEPCGPGTTVGSSIMTPKMGDSAADSEPVAATDTETVASTDEPSAEAQNSFWKKWGKWIGLAVVLVLFLRWRRR